MVSILLADDHEAMRRGVRDLLEEQPGWAVCAEAADGRQAVALAREHRPHVAILDLAMPGLNGVEATRQIRLALPETEVLVFTGSDTEHLASAAVAAGAHGYVLKSDRAAELVRAVDALAQRATYFSPSLHRAGPRRRAEGRAPIDPCPLTAREREIAQLVAEGKTSGSVALILGISVKTVETHRAHIMGKLGLESVVELVHYAVRNALIAR